MKLQTNYMRCPSDDIVAFIDGELDAEREFESSAHISNCLTCKDELNQQKQLLCALDIGLKIDLELPPDFAKLIVANAESTVGGLRMAGERFNALFISAALFLFVLFAMGSDADIFVAPVSRVIDQTAAVSSLFGHLIYSFLIGLAIILRTLTASFPVGIFVVVTFSMILAVFSLLISQKISGIGRV